MRHPTLRVRLIALRLAILGFAAVWTGRIVASAPPRAAIAAEVAEMPDEAHERPFVRRALAMPNHQWALSASHDIHVHTLVGSPAAPQRAHIAIAAADARARGLARLGATTFPSRIELFFVGSREQMRPFVGWTPGGFSVTAESAAIFVANDTVRPALRHEMMHLLSWKLWGQPQHSWISEGLAMDAVGRCHGYEIDTMAASLAADSRLVPVADLPRLFAVQGDQGVVYYTEAASIVRYVDNAYGRAGLRRLWSAGLPGIRQALGSDVATLEKGWRSHLATIKSPPPWTTIADAVRRNGCE